MPIDADDDRLADVHTPAADRYGKVPYARAGRSGVVLPRVSLGLWQNFGGDRSPASQRDIVLHAFDRGVVHIDLANNYGPPYGEAERVFGSILAADLRPWRDELFVSTMAGYDMWPGPAGDGGSRKYLMRSLEQSLTRLGTDYEDVFYHHRPAPETPLEETVDALASAVQSGKALYAGISNYPAELAVKADELLRALGVPLLIHQPRYSMFDRTPEGALFEALTERGIGTAVFSPLAQGLLTTKYLSGDIPADSRAASSRFLNGNAITDDYLERIRGIAAIADAQGVPVPQLAIAWVLRHPAVTTAIVGASRASQIDDALGAAALTLDDEVGAALEPFLAAPGERFA